MERRELGEISVVIYLPAMQKNLVGFHHFTWSDRQVVVVRSDTLFPQSSRAHVAALVGLLCVLDADALLRA